MKGLPNYTINANGRLIDLSNPQVMGILNATPDSFYEGSRKQTERDIADRANQIVTEGGSMIDIGAFSTRPGAAQVTAEEEMQRMRRALTIVRGQQPDAVLSIDTFRPEIARMAVEEFGAAIINDVSEGNINGAFGGADATNPNGETESDDSRYPAIFRMVAKLGVPYILMSTHGEMGDIMINLAREVQMLRDLGVKDIILDPGFGFGKTLDQELYTAAADGRTEGFRTARPRGGIEKDDDIQTPGFHSCRSAERHYRRQHAVAAQGSLDIEGTRREAMRGDGEDCGEDARMRRMSLYI